MSLLFPPYICNLEFKTVEELQLMPQTEEEHWENDDDDDRSQSEKSQSLDSEAGCDSEVRFIFVLVIFCCLIFLLFCISISYF